MSRQTKGETTPREKWAAGTYAKNVCMHDQHRTPTKHAYYPAATLVKQHSYAKDGNIFGKIAYVFHPIRTKKQKRHIKKRSTDLPSGNNGHISPHSAVNG